MRRRVLSAVYVDTWFVRELVDDQPPEALIPSAHRRMLVAMMRTPIFGVTALRIGQLGLSMIELLMVLVIGGLLVALAGPSFNALVHAQRGSALASGLFDGLQLTRIAAITRNDRVVMCKSVDGSGCSTIGGWHQGWIVFQDNNNNAVLDLGEAVIDRHHTLSPGWQLIGNGPVSNYVSYGSTGYSKLISGAFQAGTFTMCPMTSGTSPARQIVINSAGRTRVQKAAASVCN